MGQREIYEILKSKIISGNYNYFSANDIMKMLKDRGYSHDRKNVYNDLASLRISGFLDIKILNGSKKSMKKIYTGYRVRKEEVST